MTTATRPASAAHSAVSGQEPSGWNLPPADATVADLGGYAFVLADAAPASGGLFVVTKRVGARLYPLYAGEAEDMAAALAAFRAENPDAAAVADGLFVLERSQARVRAHTLKDVVGRFNPPLNVAHRTAEAAPEITALVADRGEGLSGTGGQPGAPMQVSEDDLLRLVKAFYAKAAADPLLGPVFAAAIPDWETHYRIVQNFWSRSLLGTSRYSGMPFASHIPLGLRPEHFTRWVALFRQTAGEELDGVAAERAIAKVEHMSVCFQAGLFPPDLAEGTGHPLRT